MARTPLFAAEPVPELRGLSSLTDPDEVGGVIDVAVFGARGDGKTQFIVHAIRTLRAHAPQLDDAERGLNREVLRVVLDPRAPRPEATPPGFVPHYTFRVRPSSVVSRLRWASALALYARAAPRAVAVATLALFVTFGAALALGDQPSWQLAGLALGAVSTFALAAATAARGLRRAGDLEVTFWDIAGEHVYSASAADYYSLLSSLISARKRRAAERGRPYAFAPVLLCNPIALGTGEAASPFERLRQLLPLFAAIDEQGGRALIAINRWSVVDPICARGALRDEIVEVTALALGEDGAPTRRVARDLVRRHCLDTEDGKDGDVRIAVLRYDTALRCSVRACAPTAPTTTPADGADARGVGAGPAATSDDDAGASGRGRRPTPGGDELEHAAALTYRYDEGPGAFAGDAASRFLQWLLRGLAAQPTPRPAARPAPRADADGAPGGGERAGDLRGAASPAPAAPSRDAQLPALGAAAAHWSRPGEPAPPARPAPAGRPSAEPRTPTDPALRPARAGEGLSTEVWARPAEALPGGATGSSSGGLR